MLSESEIAARSSYIGCSDIPAILGISPFESSYGLALKKLGMKTEEKPNSRSTAGRYMEAGIIAYARGELGLDVRPAHDEGVAHPDYEFIRGHADALVFSNDRPVLVLEAKNVDFDQREKWEGGCPDYYESQCYGYAGLYDLPVVVVACFGGNQFERYDLDRNAAIERDQFRIAAEWWAQIHAGIMPPVDGSAATTEALNRRWQKVKADMIAGTDEHLLLALERQRWAAVEKEAEGKKKLAENKLKAIIEDRGGILLPDGGKVTWNRCKDGLKLDAETLQKEKPDIFAHYQVTKPGPRTLLVKPNTSPNSVN